MNLLLTFVLSAVLVAPDSGSVAFTTATVWLRSSPRFSSRKVALLPRGAQVRIIGCREQACNVTFRRLQGYVRRERLRTTPGKEVLDPGRGYLSAKGESSSNSEPLNAEDALSLLQAEHQFSFPILLLEDPAASAR